jgi:hypothetical protein
MTVGVKITRLDHTAAELRELAVKSRDSAQSRRLLAIAMVLEGGSREDAARQSRDGSANPARLGSSLQRDRLRQA